VFNVLYNLLHSLVTEIAIEFAVGFLEIINSWFMVLMWMQKQEFMLFLCLFVLCEIMLLPHDDHV